MRHITYTNQTYVDNDNDLKTVITTLESEAPHAFTYNWALMDFSGHILACGHELGDGMAMTRKQLKGFHELAVDLYDKR